MYGSVHVSISFTETTRVCFMYLKTEVPPEYDKLRK